MRLGAAAVALACVAAAAVAQAPRVKAADVGDRDPIAAVQGLVTRLLGDAKYAGMITWQVIPADPETGNDVFELDFAGKPVIRGNSGVSLASGFHWYLKYTLNASIAWGRNGAGNQVATALAYSAFPAPAGGASRTVSSVKWRYAYNGAGVARGAAGWVAAAAACRCPPRHLSHHHPPTHPPTPSALGFHCVHAACAVCTFGYSLNWYNASDWQAEIDRLAMWGVNTPLAFFVGGQELVTRQMYTALGLTDSEVDSFIAGACGRAGVPACMQHMCSRCQWHAYLGACFVITVTFSCVCGLAVPCCAGPSFLPWQRMGNVQVPWQWAWVRLCCHVFVRDERCRCCLRCAGVGRTDAARVLAAHRGAGGPAAGDDARLRHDAGAARCVRPSIPC